MIFSTLSQSSRYTHLHPLFSSAFAFLSSTDLLAISVGIHPIIEQQVFVIIEETTGRQRSQVKLESHRKYIDIQLVIKGLDEMGWKPLTDCHLPAEDYDEKRDIQFFNDEPSSWIPTPVGTFCIFFPEDTHAPLVSGESIRKAIVKIKV
jgi:YhcH/YjgK/YiaL family protein